MAKYAYPKNLWVIRQDGCNYIVKATEDYVMMMWKAGVWQEYQPLKVENYMGGHKRV